MTATARWMWAEPALTWLGPRSAQCNPLRWSRRRCLAATAEDLAEFQGNDRYRRRPVLVETSDGKCRVHADVPTAIAALTRRDAKATDWILVKKMDEAGHKWMYVPDLVKALQESRLHTMSSISEDVEATESFERDPLLQALDAQHLEVVFATMKRSRSSSTASTLSLPSPLSSASSLGSAGGSRRAGRLRHTRSESSLANLDGHPQAFRSVASEGSLVALGN